MNDRRRIRSIAVAGGGIVGLSAALAFARALARTQVSVIETPPDPAALADRLPTALPGVERFHSAIGIAEAELIGGGIASHHLGTMFDNWSAAGEPWVHAFGDYGKPAGAIPFDQIWVRAHKLGKALQYGCYSVGAALIRAGKFVHPSPDPEFIGSRFLYGLRFDPDRYRELLRAKAAAAQIAFRAGDIAEVERSDTGGISALRLAHGRSVEADLFVDCTGPSARLIGALDDSVEDWSAWLPFGWLTLSEEPSDDVPAPASRIRTSDDRWTAFLPLRGKTLMATLARETGDVMVTRSRRLRPWVKNVLALGDAATALDPLQGTNLDAAHSAILLALELLPSRDFHAVETEEYNRRAEQVTRRVRDFVALHYMRGPWREFAGQEPPDSLARTVDQYEHRGRMPFHEDESVTRESWTAALLGLGIVPRNVDPQAGAVPLDKTVTAMERLVGEIEAAVEHVPDYSQYLA